MNTTDFLYIKDSQKSVRKHNLENLESTCTDELRVREYSLAVDLPVFSRKQCEHLCLCLFRLLELAALWSKFDRLSSAHNVLIAARGWNWYEWWFVCNAVLLD